MKEFKIDDLPTFDEVLSIKNKALTPLENFILDHEPSGEEKEQMFREDIVNLINYIRKKESDKHEKHNAVYVFGFVAKNIKQNHPQWSNLKSEGSEEDARLFYDKHYYTAQKSNLDWLKVEK